MGTNRVATGNPKFVGTLIRGDERSRGRHTSLGPPVPLPTPSSGTPLLKVSGRGASRIMRFVNNGSGNWTRRPPPLASSPPPSSSLPSPSHPFVVVVLGCRHRSSTSRYREPSASARLNTSSLTLKPQAQSLSCISRLPSPRLPRVLLPSLARDRRRLWLRRAISLSPFLPPVPHLVDVKS